MGSGGGGARRISFGSGRYATPVWSPRGDLIAFTRYGGEQGNFSIGVMRPDGSGERILSEGWLVEGPTFAPNGRVLMFWRETRARDARGVRLRLAARVGGHHRLQRAPGDDADGRIGSGLVAAGRIGTRAPLQTGGQTMIHTSASATADTPAVLAMQQHVR